MGAYSVNWEVKSSIYCHFKLLLYRKQQFWCIFIMLFSITLFNVNQFQAATALRLMHLNTYTFEISEYSFKYVNLVFHTIYMATNRVYRVTTTHQFTRNQTNKAFWQKEARNPVSIKIQVVIQGKYNCRISLTNLQPPPPDTIIVSTFIPTNPSNRDFRRWGLLKMCQHYIPVVDILLKSWGCGKWHCCQLLSPGD